MTIINKHLHEIEEELIQLAGLIKALQVIETDNSAIVCTTNAIDHQLRKLEHAFYGHWQTLTE